MSPELGFTVVLEEVDREAEERRELKPLQKFTECRQVIQIKSTAVLVERWENQLERVKPSSSTARGKNSHSAAAVEQSTWVAHTLEVSLDHCPHHRPHLVVGMQEDE